MTIVESSKQPQAKAKRVRKPKASPAVATVTIAGTSFEYTSNQVQPGAVATLQASIESAVKLGQVAFAAQGKLDGATDAFCAALAATWIYRKNGYPLVNRKLMSDDYNAIQDAMFDAACPLPSVEGKLALKNAEARELAEASRTRLANNVKTHLAQTVVQGFIGSWAMDTCNPPMTSAEHTARRTVDKAGRFLNIETLPARVQKLIVGAYKANELTLPTNYGGTGKNRSSGTTKRGDVQASKVSTSLQGVADLLMAEPDDGTPGIAPLSAIEQLHLVAAAWLAFNLRATAKGSDPVKAYQGKRGEIESANGATLALFTLAGRCLTSKLTDTERAQAEALITALNPETDQK